MEMKDQDLAYVAICTSIGEEAKAFSDYRLRSLCQKGTDEGELYEHLSGEESKHLAMLIVQLADECDTFAKHLKTFYEAKGDVLDTESD